MLDQVNIALWSKVDHSSLGQEHDRIICDKYELQSNWFPSSDDSQQLQPQKDITSNNSRVIERAKRIGVFDYTDKVGFKDGGVLQKLLRGGKKEDDSSEDEGNKKPPAKKYAVPPNRNTTTIVANPVLPINITNNNNNYHVAATSNNVNTNQYYHQLANSQSQYGNNITWGLGTNVGVGRTSNNQVVLPNNTNNNKRNYQQMVHDNQPLSTLEYYQLEKNLSQTMMLPGYTPKDNDVIVGKGRLPQEHPGNKNYRNLIAQNKSRYQEEGSSNDTKSSITKGIIKQLRQMTPPAKFLVQGEGGVWYDVGDTKFYGKVAQALREKRGGKKLSVLAPTSYTDMNTFYLNLQLQKQQLQQQHSTKAPDMPAAVPTKKRTGNGPSPKPGYHPPSTNPPQSMPQRPPPIFVPPPPPSGNCYTIEEQTANEVHQLPPLHLPPSVKKKCGKCCAGKCYNSYTKEQWKVAEDNERVCKVCEKYTALLEQENARISELQDDHLLCCQFINSDGQCEGDDSKNCSDVDDGWRPPRCSTFAHHLNGYQPFGHAGGGVKDDDSTGDDSLQFLVGGNINEYDEDPEIPPPPPPAVALYDEDPGVPPPPPPAVEHPPANLPTFVQLSPGMNGAVNDATLLNGKTFVITGNFRVSRNTISHNHEAITEMIESFGGQVLDYIPSCDYYLLRGDLMHIRSVVRCAARRERKIVMLFQLQHLLMGRRSLNDWDFQLPLSDHLKNSSGPNYTPPPDTVRRKEGTTYRLCRHGGCCPKLAQSPHNEWNWYCTSHFYHNFEGRILRYELEVLMGFEERGLELFHNLPIKLNDKQTTYRPDFHRHGSDRVEMIEIDSPHHLSKKYTKKDPIRAKRIFEWIRRNGKHAFLLHFYHGRRPKPSAVLLDWLKSFFERRTTGDIASSQDEIWLINYPLGGDTVKNMLCTFGKRIVKVGKLYEHDGVCYFEEFDCTAIYDAVMADPSNRPMGFYSPSRDGNTELAEQHYKDCGKRPAYLLAMTYGMEDLNGDTFPTYRESEQLQRIGTYLKPLKSDLVHAIEWHRRRRREPCYEEYDVELGKCLEMLGNLTYSDDIGARDAIEYDTLLEILGRLTGRSNEEGSGEETFEVLDAEEVTYLKGKVDELLQRPRHSDLDSDGLQEVREVRMRRPAVS